MPLPRPTPAELDMLAAVDAVCLRDSQKGGEGWALARDIAEFYGCSLVWARELLGAGLLRRNLIERRRRDLNDLRSPFLYALTEAGSEQLVDAEMDSLDDDEKEEQASA